MTELDAFDRRLLQALQADGRLTNAELGERVGLSASQCSRRRQRLEANGTIRGYHARLDRQRIGIGLIGIVSVTASHHEPDSASRLATLFADCPEVLEAVSLTGGTDYSLKVAVRDLDGLSRFINKTLLPHDAVRQVRTAIVLDTLKETAMLPVQPPVGDAG